MDERELQEKVRELQLLVRLFNAYVLPEMDGLVQTRVLQVMRNAVTPETLYQQEFAKGEAVGLELASSIPQTLLETAEAELRLIAKENDDEQAAT